MPIKSSTGVLSGENPVLPLLRHTFLQDRRRYYWDIVSIWCSRQAATQPMIKIGSPTISIPKIKYILFLLFFGGLIIPDVLLSSRSQALAFSF